MEARTKKPGIQRLGYRPQAPYHLDLEVFSMADLRYRGKEQVRITHKYEFHTLVCITQGQSTQMVDFKSICCGPGSVVFVRAGQAHNYGQGEDWEGWNVIFRPEFILQVSTSAYDPKLMLDLEKLPEHMVLSSPELRKVTELLQQIREDATIDAPQEDVHALLRHQLNALLTRLSILQGKRPAQESQVSATSQRFRRFQKLLDERFTEWHLVAEYATLLGCTEKSLARAVASSIGKTPKALITSRIILEAKRLLVHTDLPIGIIAERLGFDEATNFSKVFRREEDCTPAEFRQNQRSAPK